jgi:Tol biopolymer transport system component
VEWLGGGSLVVNAPADEGAPAQLWRVAYPEGRVSRLTNDINNYRGLSLSADRSSIVTSRSETRTSVWVGDGTASEGSDAVPPEVSADGFVTVAWAGERLLYGAAIGGRPTIRRIAPAGGATEEIVSQGGNPGSTSDGRAIFFESSDPGNRAGIWKIDTDGSNPVHVVSGGDASFLVVTPDDQSLVFLSSTSGLQSPWIVPIDGGTPRRLVNAWVSIRGIDVSRDGKSLAIKSRDERGRPRVFVCDLPACEARRTMNIIGDGRLRWTPDGRGLAFAYLGNLKVQPLDGRPAYQLTRFNDGRAIVDFAWSHDGKRLAVARSTTSNDIVLFKGVQP